MLTREKSEKRECNFTKKGSVHCKYLIGTVVRKFLVFNDFRILKFHMGNFRTAPFVRDSNYIYAYPSFVFIVPAGDVHHQIWSTSGSRGGGGYRGCHGEYGPTLNWSGGTLYGCHKRSPPAITGPGRTIRGSQKWSLRSCLTGPLRLIIKQIKINNDNKIIVKKMVMKMLKIINNEYIW